MAKSTQSRFRSISVRELLESKGKEWDLKLITGEEGLDREIRTFELNRPGLALAGYYDVFSVERVQLIGKTETSFLKSLSARERTRRLRRTLEFPIPCFIVTRSLPILPEMVKAMKDLKVPLLRTSHITSPFQAELGQFLERRLAPQWIVPGVMVEVFGVGALIQGKSGIGKSECGLELVERGHLLIADDIVMMRRFGRGRLFAAPSPSLGYHMEIRGIGIIDVERLFGARSVREEGELSLIVQLEKWDSKKEYERLGLTENFVTLFDCQVPQVVIPVEPGRNISQLIEIAALTQRLKSQGINLAQDFDRRILEMIQSKARRTPRSVRSIRKRKGAPRRQRKSP